MKKIRTLLALLLTALLMSSVFFFTEAEPSPEGEWQADLLKLMDPEDVPSTTEIQYESTKRGRRSDRDARHRLRDHRQRRDLRREFVFEFAPGSVSDWTPVPELARPRSSPEPRATRAAIPRASPRPSTATSPPRAGARSRTRAARCPHGSRRG